MKAFLLWLWRQFHRSPFIVQTLTVGAAVGALAGLIVGNMGLALMGTAIALSGPLVFGLIGAVLGYAGGRGVERVRKRWR